MPIRPSTPSPIPADQPRRTVGGQLHRIPATLLTLLALLGLSGCSHVAPYQREHLARRSMDTSEREASEERYASHVYEAREGAGGAGFTAGGGCGCN